VGAGFFIRSFRVKELYLSRPFKVRNADEYELTNILNLFVSPLDGLNTPFDFENTIVKGRMGSGKTMYLRANHAFYLFGLVPSLLEQSSELILPVLIRLSESPRVWWRLQPLREWSHEQVKEIFT
jgi:hypothetical protein